MGEVFLCNDAESNELVAVKVLSTASPRVVERFLREAQILAELDHPAIVRHVAHGVHDDVPYLAMPWVEGATLSDRLKKGPLDLQETLTLVERISEALALVHARGIVHRDVKPSNIVLEGGAIERAILLDFGIAHVLEADAGAELTRTGDLLGTPGYMAPEQASGAAVDARVDVFALGCVMFRCLAGRTPFAGSDPLAVAIKLLLEDAPRLSTVTSVPRSVDDLVARMLARAKEERPRDAGVVRAELFRILDPDTATQVTPMSSTPTLGHEERRVMSLVLARPRAWEPTFAAIQAIRDVLEEPIAANGAVLDVLADGSIVVTAKGGAPHDVAMRAARCALALREELPDAYVVVSTGHGVMEEDAPVGELVDSAVALLEELENNDGSAPPESDDGPSTTSPIRVDAMSAGLLSGRFEVDGDSKALSLRRERLLDRARTLLGKPTPFVGRTREIATLEAMLAECAEESVARVVVVTANPGIGKSRLREELLRRLRGRDDVRSWTAHGDPVAQGSALGMVAQLLRGAFGLAGSDSFVQKQRKIVAGVESLTDLAEPRRIAEFLGEIAGIPFPDNDSVELRAARRDPQLLGARLRRSFEDFVQAECRRGPLLVLLEDLHWSDGASIKLLDAALAATASLPLLVVAFARPEVFRAFPGLFAERGLQEIRLLELSRRASVELVQKVLGAKVDASMTDLVVSRAQGNAFFLEELIRAVAEGRSTLPETVVAMVEARLEELDAESRKVLRAAAIFGEEASAAGVQALAGGDLHEVANLLGALAQSEYLAKVTQPGMARGESVFQFRHALVREAAYAMLTDEDRKLGHRLAGEWLAGGERPDPFVLAEHFDRGGEREQAREYFQLAAEQALGRSDLDAAIALANRASQLDATGETLAACRMLQAEANIWKGDPEALSQAIETLSLVPPGTPPWFRACCGALFAAGQVADFREIVRLIYLLRAAHPTHNDVTTASNQVWAYSMATWILTLIGMYELAQEFLGRAEALAENVDEAAKGWFSIATMFACKYIRRDPWNGYLISIEASANFRRIGDTRLLILADVLLGATLVDLGAYEEAGAVLRGALEMCERSQIFAPRGDARRWLGHVAEGLHDHEEALRLETQAENEIRNTLIYRGAARAARSWSLAQLGRLDEAAALARVAIDDLTFAPSHQAHALAWLSRIELRRGRLDAALLAAEQAEAFVVGLGAIGAGETTVYVALTQALEAAGDVEKARVKLARGRELVELRARQIPEPKYRTSFLERIPEHVWLMSHEVK